MINTHPLLNYAKSNHDIKAINQWRSDVENQLQESFENGQSIRDIILARSNLIDEALQFLWKYGNKELQVRYSESPNCSHESSRHMYDRFFRGAF